MAHEEHLKILKQGVEQWNKWRFENFGNQQIRPDLSGAILRDALLMNADLSGTDLSGADLMSADLSGANLNCANLSRSFMDRGNLSNAKLMGAYLSGAIARNVNLQSAELMNASGHYANLEGSNLSGADLRRANLQYADLRRANLSGAKLEDAFLGGAILSGADLSGADLSGAILGSANLSGANLSNMAKLRGASLVNADLHNANLTSADLTDADLSRTNLVETNFTDATITGCRTYGASAWNVTLDGTLQHNLVITKEGEPVVTVDDLEVGQFIYLMLNNTKIRNVINTITSKAVLILGRFTDDRKAVLDCVRGALRDRFGLVPILFDFPPSASRDLNETIQLLASMCRFVLADLTDAKSIPQELSQIVPSLPSVPVQPILLSTQREYAMFEHWRRFPNVLPEFLYDDRDHLLDHLESGVIDPVKAWEEVTNKEAARTRQLREMVQAQEGEIAMLKAKLQRDD